MNTPEEKNPGTFHDVPSLVDLALGTRFFAKNPDAPTDENPLSGRFYRGQGKILLILGENATGKSLTRRIFGELAQRQRVEAISTSLEGRTYVSESPWLAMVYGDERTSATGCNSSHLVSMGIKTALNRTSPHIIFWDEPDLGLSEGACEGTGLALGRFGLQATPHTLAACIVTHSKPLVRGLKDALGYTPHVLHMGPQNPMTLVSWLCSSPVIRTPEEVQEANHALQSKLFKILR